jgi:hypothetical protein
VRDSDAVVRRGRHTTARKTRTLEITERGTQRCLAAPEIDFVCCVKAALRRVAPPVSVVHQDDHAPLPNFFQRLFDGRKWCLAFAHFSFLTQVQIYPKPAESCELTARHLT